MSIQEIIDNRVEVKHDLTERRRLVIDTADSLNVRLETFMEMVTDAQALGIELPQSDTLDESLGELIQTLQRWQFEFRTVKR